MEDILNKQSLYSVSEMISSDAVIYLKYLSQSHNTPLVGGLFGLFVSYIMTPVLALLLLVEYIFYLWIYFTVPIMAVDFAFNPDGWIDSRKSRGMSRFYAFINFLRLDFNVDPD